MPGAAGRRETACLAFAQAKEVEVATQVALKEIVQQNKQKDIAVIDKAKELEIAEANRSIQEANAEAAKFEAMAIREKGNAEADIKLLGGDIVYVPERIF